MNNLEQFKYYEGLQAQNTTISCQRDVCIYRYEKDVPGTMSAKKIKQRRAGEVAEWLRTLTVLAESPGSVSSTTSGGSQFPVPPWDLLPSGFCRRLHCYSVHKPTQAHTCTGIKNPKRKTVAYPVYSV